MAPWKTSRFHLGSLLLTSLLSACGGSSSSGDGNTLASVVQDLTLDPNGVTTVLTFQKNLPALVSPGMFVADGGQVALNVVVVDNVATVTWDDRVTPSHQVMPTGLKGVAETFRSVTTTDASAPTFAILAADQNPGLGGDTIAIQFSGPYVVESAAEDIASWDLVVNGVSMDLTGSVLDHDPLTQALTMTLGPDANLHASFDLAAAAVISVADVPVSTTAVAGAAIGDAVAPTFVSAVQQLPESEFGYVIDFTFSEAMDPVFAAQIANFDAGFPVFASSVEQVSDTVLRVTFNHPIVPGFDTVDLVGELMDAHGNPLTPVGAPVAVTAGSTVANGYGTTPVLETVADAGGDTLSLTFTQALDPDTADDFSLWAVESPLGNVLNLASSSFAYDLTTKSLTITLDRDLTTGDTFQVGPAAGPTPIDVDGEAFATVYAGVVTGDIAAPSVVSITQDRTLDPSGLTLDAVLSEDVDPVEAQDVNNWVVTGGGMVQTATLLPSQNAVRLVLDVLAVPGEDTFTVSDLTDLAGNPMALPQPLIAIASTDVTAPSGSGLVGFAEVGANNDRVEVIFDDTMIQSEVEDALNWTVESPVGKPLDTSGASVSYDAGTGEAVLTFDGGDEIDLKVFDDIQLTLANMRDVGGNTVSGLPMNAQVDGESGYPILETAWVNSVVPNRLHVQFSEPCDQLDDIAGYTEFLVRDDLGVALGSPSSVLVDADRHGAILMMGFGVIAGVHTLDVRGVTDLAGNQLFPVFDFPIQDVDALEPALDTGISAALTVSGEENDVLSVEFDRPVSRWDVLNPANYDLSGVDLTGASFEFDGLQTVTITLDGGTAPALETGTGYTLTVDGLRSQQGVAMTGASAEVVVAGGDAVAPAAVALRTRLDAASPADSILVEFDEAIDPADAEDETLFLKGGVTPDVATRLGHRTVRLFWAGGATAGELVDVSARDLAHNLGLATLAAEVAVTDGPVLLSVEGLIQPGFGGDRIQLGFNVPLSASTSSVISNYTADQGGVPIDLSNAIVRYASGTNLVIFHLPAGVELDPFQTLHVTVNNVTNQDGLAINPAGDLVGSVSGDLTPPDFDAALVNYRADATGLVVDVRFTEDVDPVFAEIATNFTVSGGQQVVDAQLLTSDVLRLTLSAPLVDGDEINTVALPDAAGVTSASISVAPSL